MENKAQLIPIDIKDVKLLDWLVDRSVVDRLWNENCTELRTLLKQVESEDCPLTDIADLIEAPILYPSATKIFQALANSPFGTKNLLGQYNHEYTARWARVVKLYEKDCTYLADCAKNIAQNVKYDIPLFKKQIARATQMKQDSMKKQGDCTNNISKYQQKYREKCADIGISGDHVRSELAGLVKDIPDLMGEVAAAIADIQPALSYYQTFARFLLSDPDLKVCSLLHHVNLFGNVSVCHWESGSPLPPPQESDTDSSVEIIEPIETHDKNGCVYVSEESRRIPVDTDSSDHNVSPDSDVEMRDPDQDIDFGIDTIDFGADIDFGDEVIECVGGDIGEISVVGAGEDQQNELLLDNTATRNRIVDELYELSAFLCARRDELTRNSESILAELPDCPPDIQTTQVDSLEKLACSVDSALNKLTNDKMRHLLLLQNSEKYLDRLTDTMHSQLRLVDKMEDSIEEMKQRVLDAEKTYEEIEPKLKKAIEVTKQLKACVETELSKKYKGRPVRIMGDINTL